MADNPHPQQPAVLAAKPSALPQRGVAGMVYAIMAGLAVGGLSWVGLAYGQTYPLVSGVLLLTPLPLLAVGLGIGRGDAVVAALVAMAAIIFITPTAVPAALITVLFIAPSLLLASLAVRHRYDEQGSLFWYPAGRLVTAQILYGLALLAAMAYATREAGLEKFLTDIILPMFQTAVQLPEAATSLPTGMSPENVALTATTKLVAMLPAMIITSWSVTMLVAALWVQFLLMGNQWAVRPLPKLDDFELPPALLILFAIMGLLAVFFTGNVAYLARNALLPLSLPYFFVGTALVHLWAAPKKQRVMILFAYYMLLSVTGIFMVIVALAGVLEPWLQLRQRIITSQTPQRKL